MPVRRWGYLTAKAGRCWRGRKESWGSARVSKDGMRLLSRYERFEKELTELAEEKYREIFL